MPAVHHGDVVGAVAHHADVVRDDDEGRLLSLHTIGRLDCAMVSRDGSGDFHNGRAVTCDQRITRDQCQRLGERLGHQHPIKRVVVNR